MNGNEINYPKISIITVAYNAAKTIEQTILSVINQTYSNIEYIIIDGRSTDSTVDIIKKYENKISYWVSEPDKGIYDAMNKGIDIATGDYVYFLGADDWLVDKNVIENVFKNIYLNSGFDFYCGKVYLYDSIYNLVKESGQFHSIEEIKKGAMYPHQGMFVKLEIIKEKFDIDYKIAADYELFVRNIINGTKIHFFDKVIACYNIAGSSASSQLYDEYITIIKKYFGEEYTKEILLLKEYALSNFSLRKVIKWIINSLRIRKVFLIAKGWKKYDYSRI